MLSSQFSSDPFSRTLSTRSVAGESGAKIIVPIRETAIMDARHSPFPLGWFTPGGHPDFWGDGGTYELIPYEHLPPIDSTPLDGSFAWLLQAPAGDDDALEFCDLDTAPQDTLERLAAEADRSGLSLPNGLVSLQAQYLDAVRRTRNRLTGRPSSAG